MKEINLNIVRGDTTRIGITLNNAESAPEQIIFSVKSSKAQRTYTIQKTLGNGIELDPEAESEHYIILLESEDTAELAGGKYVYDIELHINGDTITPVGGALYLTEDVTREVMA